MRWLLDVNALVALAHQGHADHSRLIRWFASLIGTDARFAGAVETLRGLKDSSRIPFALVADPLGADHLPPYVIGARQVTDGHLLALANEWSMQLATLDKGIPGAFLIP